MISFSKFHSASIDKIGRRIMKVAQYGAKTATQVAPFGIDSNPVQGVDAIFSETATDDETIILGVINTDQRALPGETRLYSISVDNTTGAKQLKAVAWLREDGSIELNGSTDNLVKYIPLNAALAKQNTLINAELTKIQVAIAALTGTYARLPVNIDISASKIDKLKTS